MFYLFSHSTEYGRLGSLSSIVPSSQLDKIAAEEGSSLQLLVG